MELIIQEINRLIQLIDIDKNLPPSQFISRLLLLATNSNHAMRELGSLQDIKRNVFLLELIEECNQLTSCFISDNPKEAFRKRLSQRNKTLNLNETNTIPYLLFPQSPANILYRGLTSFFFPTLQPTDWLNFFAPDVKFFIDYEINIEQGRWKLDLIQKSIAELPFMGPDELEQMVVVENCIFPWKTLATDGKDFLSQQFYRLLQENYPKFIPVIFTRNANLHLFHEELKASIRGDHSLRTILHTIKKCFYLASYRSAAEHYAPDNLVHPALRFLEHYKKHTDANSLEKLRALSCEKSNQLFTFADIESLIERGCCIENTAELIEHFLAAYPSTHFLLDAKINQNGEINQRPYSFDTDKTTQFNFPLALLCVVLRHQDLGFAGFVSLLTSQPLARYQALFRVFSQATIPFLPYIKKIAKKEVLNLRQKQEIANHTYLLDRSLKWYKRLEFILKIPEIIFTQVFLEKEADTRLLLSNDEKKTKKLLKQDYFTTPKVKAVVDSLVLSAQKKFLLSHSKLFAKQNKLHELLLSYKDIYSSLSFSETVTILQNIAAYKNQLASYMQHIIPNKDWDSYLAVVVDKKTSLINQGQVSQKMLRTPSFWLKSLSKRTSNTPMLANDEIDQYLNIAGMDIS